MSGLHVTRDTALKLALGVALLALAVAALAALSEGPPGAGVAGAAGAAGSPPWQGTTFPSAFDLHDRGWVTPVRSQSDYGTCWIMAATGSLESNVLRLEGLPLDFSENNLANHMSSRLRFEGMAPSELAAAYYARWEGPVLESSDPYPRPGGSPEYLRAERHVQDVLFLPVRTGAADNAAVKWAVTTYGGVDAAIDFDTNPDFRFWNAATNSYFNGKRAELDHHVLCVGWDDDYPAGNFVTRPPGDGAFLIKNSWGTGWGRQDAGYEGYFWISYHDVSFGKALAVFSGVEGSANHDAVYQYDALGRSDWAEAGDGESAWYANRFVCAGSGDLTAVSFYAPVAGTSYELRVAGSLAGVAGAPAAAAGTVAVAGYRTVQLQRPAKVTAGDSFVIAVHVRTPGWTRPVPVERPSELIAPRARSGQSFVSSDGTVWKDLTSLAGYARTNACLKAFVDDPTGAGDVRAPVVVVEGATVRPGAKVSLRWRLTDPAFSSASAVVVLTVRSPGGAVMARRRLPAVAVGERGSWTLVAKWPRGAYRVTGRAYDVAGRLQAKESRATLAVRGSVAPRASARAGTRGF